MNDILNLPPLPYQEEGLKKIHEFNGRVLIADDTGLGKTYQALAYAEQMDFKDVMICCPSKLVKNWQLEIKKLVKTGNEKRYSIVSHERLYKKRIKFLTGVPKDFSIDLLILDELHNIKNCKTQRGSAAHFFAYYSKHIIGLTATPILNSVQELIDVAMMINKDLYFNIYSSRVVNYLNRRTGEKRFLTSCQQIGAILESCMLIRRLKNEVGISHLLPNVDREFIEVELSNRKEYNYASEHFVEWASKQGICVVSKQGIVNEGTRKIQHLRQLCAQGKLRALYDMIDTFLENQRMDNRHDKMLVFFIHKPFLNFAFEKYKDISIKIDGSVTMSNRTKAIERFNTDDNIRLMFGNMKAAGEGLNRLTIANYVVFHEFDWVPYKHEQCEGRINRIGQEHKKVFVKYLFANKTVDIRLLFYLDIKQSFSIRTLDYKTVNETIYESVFKDYFTEETREKKPEPVKILVKQNSSSHSTVHFKDLGCLWFIIGFFIFIIWRIFA